MQNKNETASYIVLSLCMDGEFPFDYCRWFAALADSSTFPKSEVLNQICEFKNNRQACLEKYLWENLDGKKNTKKYTEEKLKDLKKLCESNLATACLEYAITVQIDKTKHKEALEYYENACDGDGDVAFGCTMARLSLKGVDNAKAASFNARPVV